MSALKPITLAMITAIALALASWAGTPQLASAAGTPDLQISATASNPLFGQAGSVTMTASLPAGQPRGYNLTFRAVLPPGISYAGGSVIAPTIIANAPTAGSTTLIFSNVSDLVASSSSSLSFDVSHSTVTYAVGDTYTIQMGAYVNSDARFLPKFDALGVPIGSTYTGSGTTTTVSTISALKLTKSEPSREGELLRGVHDHQTIYTLRVENNSINPADATFIDDYLPAGLEYLGCAGDPDNTTNAPTNPGSAQEYPGSGPIVVGAVANCQTPESVTTMFGDPDGIFGPMNTGVYTHVRWAVGTLAPSQVRTYSYRAAVPLAENTMDWTNGAPSPDSLDQAANLDNNSGDETVDEQDLTNYAIATGDYLGTPVESSQRLSRSAEDLLVYKDRNSGGLAQGAITTWTLTLKAGEYRYSEDIEVTDTLPNGYCPLGPVNYTTNNSPDDSECDPVGGQNPSAQYQSAVENADGTFTIRWAPPNPAKLGHTGVNDTFTISFPTRTRNKYQNNFLPTTPILAVDSTSNKVDITGNAYSRCTAPGTPDCSVSGPRIWSNNEQPEAVTDSSSNGQVAENITINKEVAASGSDCATATYGNTVPVYSPGDKVCWRLTINYPSNVDTGSDPVVDFLPPNTTYVPGSATDTPANDTTNVLDVSEAAGGVLRWDVDGGLVPTGAHTFQVTFATTVSPTGVLEPSDIEGNLLKVATQNTAGNAFPLRAEAQFETQVPLLTLAKGVRQINAGPINNPPIDGPTVRGGDNVVYQVDVTAEGDVEDVEVWDVLPAAFACGDVTVISDGGTCTGGRIRWLVPSIADAATKALTYTVLIPSTLSPEETFTNNAGVRQYVTPTNTGTDFVYTPENNIDPANPNTPNVPSIRDSSNVVTAAVTIVKTKTTSVNETNNDLVNQATIGELINYRIQVTLPAGSRYATSPRITDTPNSATTQPIVGSPTATLNGVAVPGDWSITTVGNLVTLNLPNDYTVPTSGPDVIDLYITTRISDTSTNLRNQTRTNAATFAWTGGSLHSKSSGTVSTTIVEPLISQTKSNSVVPPARALPDQIITYTLTTRNSNSTNVSTGHDTLITDTVPVGMTPIGIAPGNAPLSTGDVVPGTGGATWDGTTRTISLPAGYDIPRNGSTVWTYRTRIDNPATGGSILTNNALATTKSIAADPNARTAASTTNTGYRATSTSTVNIGSATVTKSANRTTATIGNPIQYTATLTIPAGLSLFNSTAVDVLPSSLDFDSYDSASCISGCSVTDPAPTIQTYNPNIGASTTTVAWDLGDIAPGSVARVIEFKYSAHVRATHRGSGLNVVTGQTAVNSVRTQNNLTSKFVFNPASLPASGTFDYVSPNSTTTTTITEPSVALDKMVQVNSGSFVNGPVDVVPSDSLTYQLVVRNTGTSAAHDLTVTDLPSANLENVVLGSGSGFNTVPWTAGGPAMTWVIPGPLAVGASVTLTYTAESISPSTLATGSSAINSASLTEYFGVPSAERLFGWNYRQYTGNTDTVRLNYEFPELGVQKTTGYAGFPENANAQINTPFKWRIVMTNNASTARAFNPVITDTLPNNWNYVPGSAVITGATAVAPSLSGQDIEWSFIGQSIAPGASIVVNFDATPTLAAYGAAGVNTNSASVRSEDSESNTGNASGPYQAGPNTATANLQVPVLAVTKTPDGGSLNAGQSQNWTVTVSNTGAAAATSVTVDDVLPAGFSYAQGAATATPSAGFAEASVSNPSDGSVLTDIAWTINSIPAGGTVTITVPTQSLSSASGLHTNSVEVGAANQPTTVSDTGSVNVGVSADMRATKSRSPITPTAGQNFIYTIGGTNFGPSDASGVVLTDVLPPGVSYVSGPGACSEASGTVTCTAGSVLLGGSVSYDLTVSLAPDAAAVSNTQTIAATSPDPVPSNNSATTSFNASHVADVSIVKSADPVAINNTQDTVFTLVAGNAGPSTARGVSVSDTLPAGLQYVSDDSGCSFAPLTSVVTCPLSDMAVGATVNIEITVLATSPGTWVNEADITTSNSTDPDPSNNHSEATVTVATAADLSIEKSAPATANVTDEITYDLLVTNNGPDTANTVTVEDSLPTGATYISDDAGCDLTGQDLSCEIGPMVNGATATIEVTVRIAVSAAGSTLINNSSVDGGPFDPDPMNNTSSASTTVPSAADLKITKSGPAGSVEVDDQITYGLTVENLGPDTATGVTVIDDLPSGLSYISDDAGCSEASGTLTCLLSDMVPGDIRLISIQVEVTQSASNSTLTNSADVAGDEFDPDLSNNESSFSFDVNSAADLSIAKSAPATANVTDEITYSLSITNNGPDAATGTQVTDSLPSGVTYVSDDAGCSISGQDLTCPIGNLAYGSTTGINVVVKVEISAAPNVLTNTAIVSGDQYDPDGSNNESSVSTEINPAADVSIEKTADQIVINQGAQGSFTLVATNNGPQTADDVIVTDDLPAELIYVSDDFGCAEAAGRMTCDLGQLALGQTVTIKVIVAAPTVGNWTNSSEITTSTFDPDPSDNASSADLLVGPAADLMITKTGPVSANAHQEVTYEFTVANAGPSAATSVVVTDPLPAGLQFVSSSDCDSSISCSLPDIPAGGSRSFSVVVRTTGGVAGQSVVNTAIVSSAEFDPNPDDNTSSTTTQVDPLADIGINKTGPARVSADGDIVWSLAINNAGPSVARNVTIEDLVPAGLTNVRVTTDTGSCDLIVSCQLGDLVSGGSAIVTVTAFVPRLTEEGSSITNTATVETTTDEIDTEIHESTAVSIVDAPTPYPPTLSVSKELTNSKPTVGDVLRYRITVRNSGETAARNVIIKDSLSKSLKYVSATATVGSCSVANSTIKCQIDRLEASGSSVITVKAKAMEVGKVKNTARITANNSEFKNTSASATAKVGPGSTRLTISKKADRARVSAGGRVAYRIVARNVTSQAATAVNVCDRLPGGTTLSKGGGGTLGNGRLCWKIDFFPGNSERTFRLVLRIDRYTSRSKIVNVAEIKAANAPGKKKDSARVKVKANKSDGAPGGITG